MGTLWVLRTMLVMVWCCQLLQLWEPFESELKSKQATALPGSVTELMGCSRKQCQFQQWQQLSRQTSLELYTLCNAVLLLASYSWVYRRLVFILSLAVTKQNSV